MSNPRANAPLAAPRWSAGIALPPLLVTPTRAHLFMFSAATWNRHHVHYDRGAAVREGLPDVVVHRGLVGNYLARLLTGWTGESGGAIESLAWRMVRSAVPDVTLTCRGQITAVERTGRDEVATCQVEVVDEVDDVVATGHATLRRSLPAR